MLGSGTVLGGVYGMFAALAAAQPLGYFLSAAFVKHRFGRENYPLFPSDLEREKTPCSNSPFPRRLSPRFGMSLGNCCSKKPAPPGRQIA